jgi:uncharacterized MAPEG superfamily protein
MAIELKMLSLSILLGVAQLFIASQSSMSQRNLQWNLSARDKKMPELTGIPGRLDRAFKNFMETFVFFAAAVLIVTMLNRNSNISAIGAQLYFYGRVVYVGVYAAGTPILRTIIWMASTAGILMLLSALL